MSVTAYVYAPLTSTAIVPGSHNYCNGGSQGLDCLKSGSQGSAVRLYVSTNIKSVRFTRTNNCAPVCSQDHKNAVMVELFGDYNASGCYFGWVLYGHLQNPITNQVWNVSVTKTVGYVVNYVQGQCSYYNDDDHVHMEASLGNRLVSAYNPLTQGTTAIYSFIAAC